MNDNDIAGVIEVRDYNHISLFFVKKEYQNRGVGKKLTELAITKCREHQPAATYIDVNSSPYAVHIYEKMGFVKQSEEQIKNGIRFTPLKLTLEK
jgi:ribosomal protein S18 acetylase RimI-like enzyme